MFVKNGGRAKTQHGFRAMSAPSLSGFLIERTLSLDAELAVDEMTSVPIRKNNDEGAWFKLSSGDPCAGYGDIDMLIE